MVWNWRYTFQPHEKKKKNIAGQQQGTRDTIDGVTSCFYDEKDFIYKTDSI